MASFKALDGTSVSDGDTVTLRLFKGTDTPMVATGGGELPHGDYSESELTGTVRAFDHIDRIFDEEGYAVDKKVTASWEISADDPQHSAIGFLPERVLTATKT